MTGVIDEDAFRHHILSRPYNNALIRGKPMAIKYLKDLRLDGKTVLIRVDYNVPYDKKMHITDDTRITATMPTLKYCLEKNTKLVLISHLGRPKGKPVPEMSLRPVSERLSVLLGKKVLFIDKPLGDETLAAVKNMKPGDVALLENIRFYPQEEKNDDVFGKLIASHGDIYVDDAFAAAHRGHASNDAVTRHIGECAAGLLLQDEIEYFNKAMLNPEHPTTAIIGGVKISTKIDALKNILEKVDNILIGGAMAFTFLKAQGISIGKSVMEEDHVKTAADILDLAKKKNVKIVLPVDFVAASNIDTAEGKTIVPADSIPSGLAGFDIGPKTIELFAKIVRESKTVVWNGPMGAFENNNFADGTNLLARAVAESKVLSVIGGGDSVSAINQSGYADKMSYISTGGGAFLEMLEGKILPAIKALDR
jgi:phosphoglycerate kinase